MPKIFISYRREDSAGSAGRLFENLKRRFASEQIFIDVTGIAIGQDFRKAIDEHVSACDVLLVVIGRNWLGQRGSIGTPRLHEQKDFVRLEVVSALKRDIPVVPVLVDGAAMPRHEDLPAELESLGWRQAMELRHTRWEDDVDELMNSLEKITTQSGSPKPSPTAPPAHAARESDTREGDTRGAEVRRDDTQRPIVPEVSALSSQPRRLIYFAVAATVVGVIVAGLLYYGMGRRAGSVPAAGPVEEATSQETTSAPVDTGEQEREASDGSAQSAEPPTVTRVALGDFTGTDRRRAAMELQRSGFEVTGKAVESRSEAPGVILRQDPAPGTLLEKGARVLLVYAIAPQARMPQLVGLDVKQAMITAQKVGLVVDSRRAEPTAAATPYTVIRQEPPAGAPLKPGQPIRFVYATAPVEAVTCISGYVWREAFPGDRVCVTPQTRDQVRYDNSQADNRRAPGGGAYGPNTCRDGYVWREANAKDLVCVTPEMRDLTRRDNALAAKRVQR